MGCLVAAALAGCAPIPVATPQPAAAPVTASPHRSAFAGYQAYKPEEPLKDWRDANEEVRAAGGHVGIMKGHAHK